MKEIPKNNPFRTPENYLENFSVSLTGDQVSSTGFKTPENYLDNFKVNFPVEKTKSNSKVLSIFRNYKYSAIAAAITVLIALPLLLKSNTNTLEFDNLSFEEINSYISMTNSPYDNYEFASALSSASYELEFIESESDAIASYLEDHINDINTYTLYSDEY